MITKKEIKEKGFSSIEEYFRHVKGFGPALQSCFINRMSKRQKNLYDNMDLVESELEDLKKKYVEAKYNYEQLKRKLYGKVTEED